MSIFFGKFRGVVTDNHDPDGIGRIRARVPDATGERETGWALPALPYAGDSVGLFVLPPVGANVWIEFEGGDTELPIWTGCFWAPGEPPASEARQKVLKTDVGTITLDDTAGAGGITIETSAGMKITLGSSGIEISNGKGASIKLEGPKVSINGSALEVT